MVLSDTKIYSNTTRNLKKSATCYERMIPTEATALLFFTQPKN